MTIITPELLVHLGAVAGMSTTDGRGGMNLSYSVGDDPEEVTRNRSAFFGALGIPLERLANPRQVHGAVIRDVAEPGIYPSCDALVTTVPGLYVSVTVADCVPVLVFDPVRRVSAALHAGWRGTAGHIVEAGVRHLAATHGSHPEDLAAFIGPCAGPCCYEVGEDVAEGLGGHFVQPHGNRWLADLKAANRQQLLDAGVPAGRIEVHPGCTIHESARFHSFRRDGSHSGRMMAVLGVTPPGSHR